MTLIAGFLLGNIRYFFKYYEHKISIISINNLTLQAETGNRIFQGVEGVDPFYTNSDGDKSASVLDLDSNKLVMRPDPFTAMEGCVLRPNWKMANCPRIYGKVRCDGYLTTSV